MKTDKLEELIDNSDLNKLQKNVTKGFILRAKDNEEKRQEDRDLIEQVANVKNLAEVVLSTDEVKIYTVFRMKDVGNEKYPFRAIYLDKDRVWRRVNTVSPNLDTAYIVYLEYKYLDANSRFTDFALKMLEIKIEE